ARASARGLTGVEGTRALRAAAGDVAPGWSPAAQEKRTRAAWSSRPPSAPGPTPELSVCVPDTLGRMSEALKVPVAVIAGPTGVGKTAVAIALARRVPIEVISADSRQGYRGMDAATGKPSLEARRAVPHHLVDVLDPDDRYQAARFRRDAEDALEVIRAGGRLPVVVGGTGLYIRALLRGLDPAPPADPAFRLERAGAAGREGAAGRRARR